MRHDSEIDFGALPARGASEYRGADGVYRYAYVEGKNGEDCYLYQSIDFAGEVPLVSGYHTYILTIAAGPTDSGAGWFDIEALQDTPPE